MDEQVFRAQLQADGYGEPTIVEWQPDLLNATHTHDFSARGLVLDGCFTLETSSGEVEYSVGDVFALAAKAPHAERTDAKGARVLIGRM